MKRFAILTLALLLSGCGEDSARHAIESYGFTNVRLTGFVWWGCDAKSDNPFFNTKFEATSVAGKPVSGVACGGVLKSWTVRVD